MRRAVALAVLMSAGLLSGCTLYFGDGGGSSYDDQPYPGDDDAGTGWPYPDASVSDSVGFARCEDGTIRHVSFAQLPTYMMPGHGAGSLAPTKCANGCRSAIAQCASPTDCTQADAAVCNAPIATGPIPTYQGQSCANGPSPVTYTNTNHCGQVYPGGTCTCDASTNTYGCTPAANNNTALVHAALVGKWHGTVTPPSFATPYQISLWIYPDGTYWAECASTNCYAPLYYGGNGPHPWRRITVLSDGGQVGATADIGMFYDFNIGALTSLFVTDTTLHFTFYAAWFGCSQPFDISLTRD